MECQQLPARVVIFFYIDVTLCVPCMVPQIYSCIQYEQQHGARGRRGPKTAQLLVFIKPVFRMLALLCSQGAPSKSCTVLQLISNATVPTIIFGMRALM